MDLQRQKKMGGLDSTWTNEKHLSFLDSMEASFVRRMFENDDRYFSACTPHLHLERYLPEGADSTLDFEHHNGPGKTLDLTPESSERRKPDSSSKIKKRRTGSCVPDNPSTDQVAIELMDKFSTIGEITNLSKNPKQTIQHFYNSIDIQANQSNT